MENNSLINEVGDFLEFFENLKKEIESKIQAKYGEKCTIKITVNNIKFNPNLKNETIEISTQNGKNKYLITPTGVRPYNDNPTEDRLFINFC
jgi:ribosomal protein L2